MFLLLADSTIAIDADVVIVIVGNYIEKAEVIEEAVKAGKKVILFFSKYQDPENTIPSEEKSVEEFKEKMSKQCCCVEYNGMADFKVALVECANVIDL